MIIYISVSVYLCIQGGQRNIAICMNHVNIFEKRRIVVFFAFLVLSAFTSKPEYHFKKYIFTFGMSETQEFYTRLEHSKRNNWKCGVAFSVIPLKSTFFLSVKLTGEIYRQLWNMLVVLPWVLLLKFFHSIMEITWFFNRMVLLLIMLWTFPSIFHGLEKRKLLIMATTMTRLVPLRFLLVRIVTSEIYTHNQSRERICVTVWLRH